MFTALAPTDGFDASSAFATIAGVFLGSLLWWCILVSLIGGLPIVKPPYGVVASIDLGTGKLRWQVAHGETPDVVRNHPALKGKDIPKTGQPGNIGVIVTKSLVIAGDFAPAAWTLTSSTPSSGRPRSGRTYDAPTSTTSA